MFTTEKLFLTILALIMLSACKFSEKDKVVNWSNSIKNTILNECRVTPDSVWNRSIHDTIRMFAAFKNGKQIMTGRLDPQSNDTLTIVYWGSDYHFAFARRFCPFLNNESEEMLLYKGRPFGLHKVFYCNGVLKREGLEADEPVGVWISYDERGKLIKDTNYYHMNKFDSVGYIKYGG
jgi:antitoxin component YwqK of YwqJK toxin-antitoxin module